MFEQIKFVDCVEQDRSKFAAATLVLIINVIISCFRARSSASVVVQLSIVNVQHETSAFSDFL